MCSELQVRDVGTACSIRGCVLQGVDQESAEHAPQLLAMLLKLHKLGLLAEAEAVLSQVVRDIAAVGASLYAWASLKLILQLEGFTNGFINGLLQVGHHPSFMSKRQSFCAFDTCNSPRNC